MIIERTNKSITIYPKVKTGEEENLRSLKRESLSIERKNEKAVIIQRGHSHSSRAKLSVALDKNELKSYITELQNIYDEIDGTRLNRLTK